MSCIHDGILRAYLDTQLAGSEVAETGEHLASCTVCRDRFKRLRAEAAQMQDLLATLSPSTESMAVDPAVSYTQFKQLKTAKEPAVSWVVQLFAPRWRPVWGLGVVALVITILVSVAPVRSWAQRMLAMLRVQKIQVVSIDPTTLMSGSELDSTPHKLIDQFVSDSLVVTVDPGRPEVVSSVTKASQLVGYPVRTIESLGGPSSVEINGESAFQMTINRDRIVTLLDEIGRSDIQIPESVNGALIAVHIPKIVISVYGDCPVRRRYTSANRSQVEALAERKMERMGRVQETNCTYLIQAPSPTVSVPPDFRISEIAEAALELAGMSPPEARSFCQTVDWSSTLVVPLPRNSTSYQTVTVDGVEGTLISSTLSQGNRYSLLWIKDGMIHSLAGHGSASDALTLAASLR